MSFSQSVMFSVYRSLFARIAAISLSATALIGRPAVGEEAAKLSEPIYRVANETGTTQQAIQTQAAVAPATPAAQAAPAAVRSPYDLTLQTGEHPLTPFIRACKMSADNIDQNVRDYSCTLVKRERVDGELGEPQHISMRIRQQPFSVYMKFIQPFPGREVLYVDGKNNNEMTVLEAGWKRTMLGKMNFSPDNAIVMKGQKYPVTRVGMRNLMASLMKASEAETKFAECEVTSDPNVAISGRSTTKIQVVHPIPRQNFRAHVTRVFFDNEFKVPVHYDAFSWPDQPGQQPQLEESYTYTNLKLNNGFTARDFDTDNPEIFKP